MGAAVTLIVTRIGNLRAKCSIDLTSWSEKKVSCKLGLADGGCARIRTLDPLIKSQLLYQLSYTPVATDDYGGS